MGSTPIADALPSDAAATKRVAEVARAATSDVSRAMVLAQDARAAGVSNPLIHHLVALRLKDEGKFEEAIAESGLGLALDPQDPRLMTTVGFCLIELGRRREAAHVFGVAVKLDPSSAEASYGYGWAAEGIGALDQAESAFRRTLAIDPNHADALAGLAGLATRSRDWDGARSYATRAAALDGKQTDALMNLARVDIGVADFAAAERRLGSIIELPHLKPLARANARIMLGDALDGAGRYREAFEAYGQGKAEIHDLYADRFERPGAGAVEGVRQILAQFQDTPAESWKRPVRAVMRDAERAHVFLLGFPRSGTTLLEQVLATHPDVVALEERPVLQDAEIEFLTSADGVKRLSQTVSDLLEPLRQSYWRRVREFGVEPRDKVFVDKQPLNTFRLPLICKLFPDAKIVFAVRDPRDVVLSCFRRSFNINASMYQFCTISGAAKYYVAVMEAGEAYASQLSLELKKVRYEDLIADFEGTARGLCDFLGLERTDRLKDFAETARARRIATPSSAQVGRGLYEEGVGQWRRYAFALEPVAATLQPWIEKFGYAAQ